jgi:hypothetical protein
MGPSVLISCFHLTPILADSKRVCLFDWLWRGLWDYPFSWLALFILASARASIVTSMKQDF